MLNSSKNAIAIIDSGIGGISILKQLLKIYGTGNFIYFADNQFMPYGNKSKEFVKNRVENIIYYLRAEYNVDKIIVACNTASSSIRELNLKDVEILTFDKNQTYLTTPLTATNLKGYKTIVDKNLAKQIEKHIFNKTRIDRIIHKKVKKLNLDKLKSLVLGCTHFELVEDLFKKHCPNIEITLNSTALIKNIKLEPAEELNITIVLSKLKNSYGDKIIKLIDY